jgi:thioredoxin reductase
MDIDVAVIGSGPAGLQAALTLARGQRSVAVVEGRERRNAAATHVWNVIGRDGTPPQAFRDQAWADLGRYPVRRVAGEVLAVSGGPGGFRVETAEGGVVARRVLLATGVFDTLPGWAGLGALWGDTVFQCPFCHGHALRGLRWAVWVPGPELMARMPLLRAWTHDLVVLTDGWEPDVGVTEGWARRGVAWFPAPIADLLPASGDARAIGAVRLADGQEVLCRALVLTPTQRATKGVGDLGLALDGSGFVAVDALGRTSVAGISAAGDATTRFQSAVAAMASGQLAAAGLCHDLAEEDWAHHATC